MILSNGKRRIIKTRLFRGLSSNEKLEMIPLTLDVVFKGIFETNLDLLKDFLISVLNLKVDYESTKIHLSNTELPK